jgi:hypothetical protein
MIYRLFGWWFRWQACKMAAQMMAARLERPEEGICPALWSAVVFFETYMLEGSGATHDDFGPKEPAELKAVNQ